MDAWTIRVTCRGFMGESRFSRFRRHDFSKIAASRAAGYASRGAIPRSSVGPPWPTVISLIGRVRPTQEPKELRVPPLLAAWPIATSLAASIWFWITVVVGLAWLKRHLDLNRGKREPI